MTRRHLAVTAAQIEPDAASVEVTAQRGGARPLGRQVLGDHHLDRMAIGALAHQLRVEQAGRGVAVVRPQALGQVGRTIKVDPEPTPRPQSELHQPLEHEEVRLPDTVASRQQRDLEVRDGVLLLEREPHHLGMAAGAGALLEGPAGERGWTEQRIERRPNARGHQGQSRLGAHRDPSTLTTHLRTEPAMAPTSRTELWGEDATGGCPAKADSVASWRRRAGRHIGRPPALL